MAKDDRGSCAKMKKIAVFLYSMGAGGAERVVSNLLPFLSDEFEVHLVLMSDVVSYEIPNKVKVHFIEHSDPYEKGIKKIFRLFFTLPILAFKFKKLCENLDIKIFFVLMNRPCYIAIMARILGLKGRMVISERSCPSVIYKNGLNGFVNRAFVKFLYPKADLILANAKGNAGDLAQNFGIDERKIKVLYNALDLKSVQILKSEPLNSEFKPFFINIGRLDSGKNQSMLIRAIAKIDDKNASLGILGKGDLKDELQKLIDELGVGRRVKLLGVGKNPFKFINSSKCLVCASRFEGFSNVLIEALACEKTIITTEHESGARELIGDNEYGILVPVDDEEAMMTAMKKVLNDENLRAKYESRAYKKALEFDGKNIANELIKYLKD